MQKIALVTGSTSGIGLAVAKKLISESVFVIISSETPDFDTSKLTDVEREMSDYMQIDISSEESIKDAAEKIKLKHGKLDYLHAHAGIIPQPCSTEEITEEGMDRTINVNLKGTFWSLKYFGKLIQTSSKNGAIVCTTSVDGIIGEPFAPIYSATKAGIISLTKSFARYFQGPLVRVNAVAPGLIDTPLTASTGEDPAATTALSLIKRMGQSEEIADSVYFLLSDSASYITGQVLAVDGGFTLK